MFKRRVLVVGDSWFERIVSSRHSPDARRNLALEVTDDTYCAGGAARIANMLASLGCETHLLAPAALAMFHVSVLADRVVHHVSPGFFTPSVVTRVFDDDGNQITCFDKLSTSILTHDDIIALNKLFDELIEKIKPSCVVVYDGPDGVFVDAWDIIGTMREHSAISIVCPASSRLCNYPNADIMVADLKDVCVEFVDPEFPITTGAAELAEALATNTNAKFVVVRDAANKLVIGRPQEHANGQAPIIVPFPEPLNSFRPYALEETATACIASYFSRLCASEPLDYIVNAVREAVVGVNVAAKYSSPTYTLTDIDYRAARITAGRWPNDKTCTRDTALRLRKTFKDQGRRLVVTYCQSDKLDIDDVYLLTAAKMNGEVLLVLVPRQPMHKSIFEERVEMLSALACVDLVVATDDVRTDIVELQPDVLIGHMPVGLKDMPGVVSACKSIIEVRRVAPDDKSDLVESHAPINDLSYCKDELK